MSMLKCLAESNQWELSIRPKYWNLLIYTVQDISDLLMFFSLQSNSAYMKRAL